MRKRALMIHWDWVVTAAIATGICRAIWVVIEVGDDLFVWWRFRRTKRMIGEERQRIERMPHQ